jgi:hypothetical protein
MLARVVRARVVGRPHRLAQLELAALEVAVDGAAVAVVAPGRATPTTTAASSRITRKSSRSGAAT